jgi:hypothetical protein
MRLATNVIGRQMEIAEGAIAAPQGTPTNGGVDSVLDENWVRTAFVLPADSVSDKRDAANRYWNSAQRKFTDGRWGCNIGINPPAQFTPYADPPNKGRMAGRVDLSLTDSTGNYGMGEYWSEMYDDPAQIVYMRFGVPQFNSFLDFFSNAFHHGAGTLARTGRYSTAYAVSSFIGTALMLTAFPLVTVPLLIYKTADYFFFRQSAKFYHMKPTMHLYWGAVNTLVNTLALNSGIYPKIMKQNANVETRIGMPFEMQQADLDVYHDLAPDIFSPSNYIDVFALANRAQRIANKIIADEFDETNNTSTTSFSGYVNRDILDDDRHRTRFTDETGKADFMDYLNRMLMFSEWFRTDSTEKNPTGTEEDPRTAKKTNTNDPLYGQGAVHRFGQHLDAEFRLGGQFAIFRVDFTGASTESFSNATTPSDLENKFNSTSSSFAHKRFTLGNGAIFGDLVDGIATTAADVVTGLAAGMTMNITDSIRGILGDGYIDIPEHWQSSSAALPSANYKMVLETPYGNALSRIMNLFVPFAMVAAGAWPRSVGRQSYTSPFLCQVWDKGRVQIPLGMITELTITRGRGNLGFTTDGKPLSIEVSWRVRDLSRILHMPLMPVLGMSNTTMIDEESAITNYLSAVAGQSLEQQIYPSTRAKVRMAKLLMNAGVVSSPAFWASFVHDRGMNGTFVERGVGGLFESLVRNTENTSGSTF